MDPVFDLDVVDVDGAIRETADAVPAHTRAAFFKKAAIGGGAVLGSGAVMGMLPTLADAAPSKKQDIAILNFALTLEYLESAFYAEAVSGSALSGDVKQLASLVATHEKTHVATLHRVIKTVLHGKVVNKPKFNFRGTTGNQSTFVQTAFVLENTGVHAYLGQATRLQSKALLAAAASIVTVEARHASAFAIELGKSPFLSGTSSITPNGSFDQGLSMKRILHAVEGTHFITG